MSGEVAYFEYPSAKTFVTLLEVIGEVADEILMDIGPEAVQVKALDPARLSLIEVRIPSSAFTQYSVRPEGLRIGLNLSSLLKILPKPKKGEVLKFSADESFYSLLIEGTAPKLFRFRSIEVSAEEIPELSLEFKVRARVLSKAFKQALTDLKGSGTIEIEVPATDYILLKGGGSTVKMSRVSGSIIDIEFEENVRSAYEESYLAKVLPLSTLTDSLTLELSSSSPLRMTFDIPGDIVVRYTLAPQT
jgi:proliferating cell nuclear antigen